MIRRRQLLATAQNGICPWCEKPLPADLLYAYADIDHIIPRSRGGPDLEWNRQLLHKHCNRDGKGDALTPQAEALAAEHGVTLVEPPPKKPWGYWLHPEVRRRTDLAR